MALIKHAEARDLAREAIVLDLGDLARQGEQLRSRSKAEADAILANARAERDRLLAGAREEGRREGLELGLAEGRRQGAEQGRAEALAEAKASLDAMVAAWTSALGSFEGQRDAMLLEARRDVLRLALKIAEKVTKRAIRLDPAVVKDQLAAVLSLVTKPTGLTIAVHPDDLARARETLPALCERLARGSHVELVADASLAPGSCVARTAGGGEIDASIDGQLDRIVEALLPGEASSQGEAGEGDAEAGS